MDFSLSEELVMIRDMARDFVTNELLPIERDVLVREKGGSRGAPIPSDKRARLKKLAVEQGLWAMSVPEALGGGGLSTLGACLVAEELGKSFVDFDFGDIPPILFEADLAQRQAYLTPAISGEKECAVAIAEPDGGGPGSIQTRASQKDEGWCLNGIKLVSDADFYLVLAETDSGPAFFLVDTVPARDGRLVLEETTVQAGNVLGPIGGATALSGKYRDARLVRTAARKIGAASRLLEMSAQYARDWKSLGQSLAVHPSVRCALADMEIETEAARWLVYRAADQIDGGMEARREAARASLYAAEMVARAIDRTNAVFGGPAFAAALPLLDEYGRMLDRDRTDPLVEMQRLYLTHELVRN